MPLLREEYIVIGSHCAQWRYACKNLTAIIGFAIEVCLQLVLYGERRTVPGISDFDEIPLDVYALNIIHLTGRATT